MLRVGTRGDCPEYALPCASRDARGGGRRRAFVGDSSAPARTRNCRHMRRSIGRPARQRLSSRSATFSVSHAAYARARFLPGKATPGHCHVVRHLVSGISSSGLPSPNTGCPNSNDQYPIPHHRCVTSSPNPCGPADRRRASLGRHCVAPAEPERDDSSARWTRTRRVPTADDPRAVLGGPAAFYYGAVDDRI